jgi:chromosome segregation ATPase
MLRTFVVLTIFAVGPCPCVFAQSKADRKDEKRENERVNDAKQDLQKAQRELGAAVKAYRVQGIELQRTDAMLHPLQVAYSQAREAAEERLADSTGLPAAIRKMRGLREEIVSLSTPILEQVKKTDKWKAASKQANDAQQARDKLLADESRTDDELATQLIELDKQIAAPASLAAAAIDADPKVSQLKSDYQHALDAIADLRRKIDSSKIDADPEVKSRKSKVQALEREIAIHRNSLAKLNAKVANMQSAVVGANRKLQQAQAADQKDSNKPKKK